MEITERCYHEAIGVDEQAVGELVRIHEDCLNLKAMLMDLGNRLLREHGFKPAQAVFDQQRDAAFLRSTQMIAMFIAWLNRVPDAQKILTEYGLEWPVGQFHGKAKDDYVALD